MLNEGEITGLTMSVLVSYLFAAILHVNNTGYFLYGLFFSFSIRREHDDWVNKSDDAEGFIIHDRRSFVIDNDTVALNEATADEHEIVKETGDGGKAIYLLRTWGVLTDGQLHGLITRQRNDNAQRIIALAGLDAQLAILEAPALPRPKRREEIREGAAEDKASIADIRPIRAGKPHE